MSDQPDFDFEAAPGPPAQLPTQKAQSVRQPGWMGGEKVGSSPYHQDADGGGSCHQAGESPATDWREVPQATFLSWPEATQLAYCSARDEHAALDAEGRGEDPAFYLERAEGYRCLMNP